MSSARRHTLTPNLRLVVKGLSHRMVTNSNNTPCKIFNNKCTSFTALIGYFVVYLLTKLEDCY